MKFSKLASHQQQVELSYGDFLAKIAPINLPMEEINYKSLNSDGPRFSSSEEKNRYQARVGAQGSLSSSFFMIGSPATVDLDYLP